MIYHVAIIGAGPAGMTAALYAMRAGMSVLLLEKAFPGGQMVSAHLIENYPGIPSVSGAELAQNMKKQLTDITYRTAEIIALDCNEKIKKISSKKEEFQAENIIIASGAAPKKLGLQYEEELTGRGVSYCATCDGAFYKGKTATVIGGGNTALEDALYLANFCKKVNLVHRRNTFRGDITTLNRIKQNNLIDIYTEYVPVGLNKNEMLSSVTLEHTITKEPLVLETDAVFVAIGYQPNVSFLPEGIALNPNREIITDKNHMTNYENVYAIGDVKRKDLRQIVTACSDGAEVIAAIRRKASL